MRRTRELLDAMTDRQLDAIEERSEWWARARRYERPGLVGARSRRARTLDRLHGWAADGGIEAAVSRPPSGRCA